MLVRSSHHITVNNEYKVFVITATNTEMYRLNVNTIAQAQNRKKLYSKKCLRNINYDTISHNENIQYYSMEIQLPMLCKDDRLSYHNKLSTYEKLENCDG